jgi:hypothetical protein
MKANARLTATLGLTLAVIVAGPAAAQDGSRVRPDRPTPNLKRQPEPLPPARSSPAVPQEKPPPAAEEVPPPAGPGCPDQGRRLELIV